MPIDKVVGHYRIVRSLGQGGMGEVFVAQDTTLKRLVAIKSIRPDHRMDDTAKRRFLREARILSSLDHPLICKIYDFIESAGNEYLVLEYIDGITLTEAVRNGLDRSARLHITEQLLRVLAAAHAEGIVHRDFKPDNVMVTASGDIKVLDFGLAYTEERLREDELHRAAGVSTGESDPQRTWTIEHATDRPTDTAPYIRSSFTRMAGTPHYMSPEQARGESVTVTSDLYALGLVLQFMFTEHPPYDELMDVETVLDQARRCQTRPLTNIDSDLKSLITSLKSPTRSDRPSAMQALATLRRIRDKPRRRLRRLAAAAVLLIIALAGVKYTIDVQQERRVSIRRQGQAENMFNEMLQLQKQQSNTPEELMLAADSAEKLIDSYYGENPESQLENDELFNWMNMLILIGEMHFNAGDFTAAERNLRHALERGEQLRDRDPDREAWLAALGAVHFWIGNIHWERNDLDEARDEFLAYRVLADRLVVLNPRSLDWQLEQAQSLTNLAAVLQAMGTLEQSLDAFHDASHIKRALYQVDPANVLRRRSLATGISWEAGVQMQLGRLPDAQQLFLNELDHRRALYEIDPANLEDGKMLSMCHGKLCLVKRLRCDFESALEHARLGNRFARELVEINPANTIFIRELAVSHRFIGDCLLMLSRLEEARQAAQLARNPLSDLVGLGEGITDWQLQLVDTHHVLARIALAQDQPDEARQHVAAAEAIIGPLALSATDNRDVQKRQASLQLLHARLADHLEDASAAMTAARRALETIEPFTIESNDPTVLLVQAQALLALKADQRARALLERLQDMGVCSDLLQPPRHQDEPSTTSESLAVTDQ